jgi:hypothetical protein
MTWWLRLGRLGSHGKEKYGTFRHHVYFYSGGWPIHELVKPGYVFYQWPYWMMNLEVLLSKPIRLFQVDRLVRMWQLLVYRAVLWVAVRRFRNVAEELTEDREDE